MDLKKSPLINHTEIYHFIKYRFYTHKIQLQNSKREEFNSIVKQTKESNVKIITDNTKNTRNKRSKFPKISKRSIVDNYNINQTNSNTILHNNLSLGMPSIPAYQDYTKVYSAFIFNKFDKLLHNNNNLKEIDKLSVFRKYLIETKNLMNKRTKFNLNIKKINHQSQSQSKSKEIRTSRSGRRSKINTKVVTNLISLNSHKSMSNLVNYSLYDKKTEHYYPININKTKSNTDLLSPRKTNNNQNKNTILNDHSVINYSENCVGNDIIMSSNDKYVSQNKS